MLLVLGSAVDDQPRALVERWSKAGIDVGLATPADLSCRGWQLRCGRPSDAVAALDGRLVAAAEIQAVVSMLPWVGVYDIPHVAPADRDYVAQEMTAFLLAWLKELECPVIDRPSALSLSGCGRSQLEWLELARGAALAADAAWEGSTLSVTVVGEQVADEVPTGIAAAALTIARLARRSLVTLRFASVEEPTLVGADVRPTIDSDATAAALLERLKPS